MTRSYLSWLLLLLFLQNGFTQETGESTALSPNDLLNLQEPLSLALRFSIDDLKEQTNDSTHLEGMLYYWTGELARDSIPVMSRVRGRSRRDNCYYPPMTLRFSQDDTRGTIFEGHEEIKLVLPCKPGPGFEDYVIKELAAYKLFEQVSPYFYRTRLMHLDFTELRGRRERHHELSGFILEDHGTLADRLEGKRVRRNVAPQMQDPLSSIRNNLFEYLIGNTDFSLRQQHNQRLYYIGESYVSLPYDFDMSGLVNAPYATVNNTQNLDGSISDVTQRLYKGYARDTALVLQVRAEFLKARSRMEGAVASLEPYFTDPREFTWVTEYIKGFFGILENDSQFERRILRHMRGR